MSSLAVGCGLGVELWLAGLFSSAELAAADLLLQLSVARAGGNDEAAESSTSATTFSSRSSASPCPEGLTGEEDVEREEQVLAETALPLGSTTTELDRRAKKRYRTLSDLYAATIPVPSASASGAKKKNKRKHGDGDVMLRSSSEEETRYGGDH